MNVVVDRELRELRKLATCLAQTVCLFRIERIDEHPLRRIKAHRDSTRSAGQILCGDRNSAGSRLGLIDRITAPRVATSDQVAGGVAPFIGIRKPDLE